MSLAPLMSSVDMTWRTPPAIARFWSKIDRSQLSPGGCWPWTCGVDKDGYGKFQMGPHGAQIHVRAHRFALELDRGSGGPLALHGCDNPACCNPAHLRWGTQKENRGDCRLRGRTLRGERADNAKLTDADIIDIRTLVAFGARQCDLAESFNVSRGAVSAVVTRRLWRHLP